MAEKRPRARPRPRPVPRLTKTESLSSVTQNHSQEVGSSSAACSSSTAIPLSSPNGAAKRVLVVEDTDEMFIRNRNRSSKTWQKLEQLDRKITEERKLIWSESESDELDEDENVIPRRRRPAKKESTVVPVWRQNQERARMLSRELSDGSDVNDSKDASEINASSGAPSKQRNGKRKRRSPSRSITPPPALPIYHIQHARQILRQTLEAAAPATRSPSPTAIELDLDDSSDANLQPELMALVQRVRNESQSGTSQYTSDAMPGEELSIVVKWHPHPLADNTTEAEWHYKVDKMNNFRELFDSIAEDVGVLQKNVILTHQGNRFYPSVTPHILKIWSDTAEFDAYEQKAYEYIHANHQRSMFSLPSPRTSAEGTSHEPIDIHSDSEGDIIAILRGSTSSRGTSTPPRFPSQSQTHESDSDSDSSEKNTLKLVLRSALTGSKEITLTVRTTTRCDAVVKAFIKKAGLGEEEYPRLFDQGQKAKKGKKSTDLGKDPRLSVDGDRCDNDTQIGQIDVEDGDMIEVVGL